MARTLSITDDDLGVRASVRVEESPDGPIVTSVHYDAIEGRGISAPALALIETLGLRLPAAAPPPPARRGRPRKATVAAKPAKRARQTRAAPGPTTPGDPAAADPDPAAIAGTAARALPAGPPTQRRPRRHGEPPSPAELAELFTRHHGSTAAIADELNAAHSTVRGWLRNARDAGAHIAVDEPATTVGAPAFVAPT